ncbi:MAG: DUF3857 and transglutaminase domain-containing protein [Planctomycetota bacterium]
MRRFIIISLLAGLFAAPTLAQGIHDVLYLQDGRERVGELISVTADQIIFHVDGAAEPEAFPKDQVQRIDITRWRAGDRASTVGDLKDPLLERLIAEQPSAAAFPDSGHVVLHRMHEYTLAPDGSYTLRERRVEKVLLERGKDQATVARYFRKGEETLEIDFARTINPDGSLTPISDAAVDIASTNAGTPEYEKLHQVKFAMKQVRIGSLLDYQITIHRASTDPLFPFYTSLFFRDSEPLLEAELRINVPRGHELKYRLDRADKLVELTRVEEGDQVSYRFQAHNCPRIVPESMMPPAGDLYPRVTASLATGWNEIGEAFGAAMRASGPVSAELKARVAELIANTTDPQQRARAVYHYFNKTVLDQGIRPEEYSYAPQPVADVFARRAGGTIDRAVLLCTMLEEAGLSAGVVLACPQYRGCLLDDLPNIRQLDSALVAVTLPSGRQFLPPADEAVRFGQMPTSFQGTRGLLVTTQGSELVEIPLNEPDAEMIAADYQLLVMPNGDLRVTKTETLTGNNEIARRRAWKDLKDEELRRNFEMALTGLHPKAHLDDYTIENLHDVTQPLTFTQKFTLEDYTMRAGDELLVFKLPDIDYDAAAVGKPTREFPLRWYGRTRLTKSMTVELPPGFRIYYAGKDYTADCGVVTFNATFNAAGREIRYEDVFIRNELEAPPEQYADYKAAIETRARVAKEWIVLERITE